MNFVSFDFRGKCILCRKFFSVVRMWVWVWRCRIDLRIDFLVWKVFKSTLDWRMLVELSNMKNEKEKRNQNLQKYMRIGHLNCVTPPTTTFILSSFSFVAIGILYCSLARQFCDRCVGRTEKRHQIIYNYNFPVEQSTRKHLLMGFFHSLSFSLSHCSILFCIVRFVYFYHFVSPFLFRFVKQHNGIHIPNTRWQFSTIIICNGIYELFYAYTNTHTHTQLYSLTHQLHIPYASTFRYAPHRSMNSNWRQIVRRPTNFSNIKHRPTNERHCYKCHNCHSANDRAALNRVALIRRWRRRPRHRHR